MFCDLSIIYWHGADAMTKWSDGTRHECISLLVTTQACIPVVRLHELFQAWKELKKKRQWGSATILNASLEAPLPLHHCWCLVVRGAGCSLTFQAVHTQGWTSCIPPWSFCRTWSPRASLDMGCFLLREHVSNVIPASAVKPRWNRNPLKYRSWRSLPKEKSSQSNIP